MYLFVLILCGMLEVGVYFLFYHIVEIILIAAIWCADKRKGTEHFQTVWKSVGDLILYRIGSTAAWCVFFSVTNRLLTPPKENGWEILSYGFPPDIYFIHYPYWHLIITLAVCMILTLAAFQLYILKKKKLFYHITISITALIMFSILTSVGVPLYWH